ncbi:MAG: rod shape-determining protein MreD [Nocardioidaceae bacterium]|nr:rod shape-determining protein MreD [Nocardioidaceae bacterium]
MNGVRPAILVGLVTMAVVAQSVLFRHLDVEGVVPNLALVVTVVAAIARGPQFGAVLGFGAGLLLDVAPPADHVAGRWALALVLVGYLAGRVRQDARSSTLTAVLVVGAASFVGTSVYALTGLVVDDHSWAMGEMLQVVVISVLWDLALAPFLVPLLLKVMDATQPARAL